MGFFGNLFRTSGGGAPQAQSAIVSASATGAVFTLARDIDPASTLTLLSGSSSNLSLSGVTLSATAALGGGASQKAIVREALGDLAKEYPVTISTAAVAPDAPALLASSGNGQVTLAWNDGSAGGSPITAHNIYAGTTLGGEVLLVSLTGASPYIDTGLTNGVARYYRIAAVNAVGEGALSAEISATPVAWILGSGAWNDGAPWDDTQTWKDAA